MKVKTIVDEDFTNYKKPAMFIGAISCNGKCCIEAGIPMSICQNDGWRSSAPITISTRDLIERYLKNPVTESIVFGGLEPFEQFKDIEWFLRILRTNYRCEDDVVIYTGYYPHEINDQLKQIAKFKNIIVKFGRYVPNKPSRYDNMQRGFHNESKTEPRRGIRQGYQAAAQSEFRLLPMLTRQKRRHKVYVQRVS